MPICKGIGHVAGRTPRGTGTDAEGGGSRHETDTSHRNLRARLGDFRLRRDPSTPTFSSQRPNSTTADRVGPARLRLPGVGRGTITEPDPDRRGAADGTATRDRLAHAADSATPFDLHATAAAIVATGCRPCSRGCRALFPLVRGGRCTECVGHCLARPPWRSHVDGSCSHGRGGFARHAESGSRHAFPLLPRTERFASGEFA